VTQESGKIYWTRANSRSTVSQTYFRSATEPSYCRLAISDCWFGVWPLDSGLWFSFSSTHIKTKGLKPKIKSAIRNLQSLAPNELTFQGARE